MKSLVALATVVTVMVATGSICHAEARKWTDATGKFSAQAEFVRIEDGNVVLKRTDGPVIRVPLKRLSEQDQRYVASLKNRQPVEDARFVVYFGPPRPRDGKASLVVNRLLADGSMKRESEVATKRGRITLHPTKPVLYLSSIREHQIIGAFTLDHGGKLTSLSGFPVKIPTAGRHYGPRHDAAITADDRFMYVVYDVNPNSEKASQIFGYRVRQEGGLELLKQTIPATDGPRPHYDSIVTHPSGKFVYVGCRKREIDDHREMILGFGVKETGELELLPGFPVDSQNIPKKQLQYPRLTMDAKGQFLFVANQGQKSSTDAKSNYGYVITYRIDPSTGQLSPTSDKPWVPPDDGSPRILFHANGTLAYISQKYKAKAFRFNRTKGIFEDILEMAAMPHIYRGFVGFGPEERFIYEYEVKYGSLFCYPIDESGRITSTKVEPTRVKLGSPVIVNVPGS